MEINYFDLIIAIIILLLGLKGVLNGFFKEFFGLVGIIGGIFVASRLGESVGEYLNNLIFHFSSHSAVSFTGFLVTLAIFWLFMVFVGYLFKKLSAMSGLGVIDRVLGFVFGASKFFLIAAVIAFAVNNVKALKSTIESAFSNSTLFPVLVETGGFIMKIDPGNITQDINNSIEEKTKNLSEKIKEKSKEIVQEEFQKKTQEIEDELKEEK